MAQQEDNQDNQQQQSNTNIGLNQPKIGMNLDSNPIDISGAEYTLLLNGNILSADGNILKITNEPSSLLCSRFKPGYLAIGKPLYIPTQKLTIFFLVNPETNSSEVGMITNTYYDDTNDRNGNCADCNKPIIEDIPLEKTIQTPLCNYVTIVNAPCLNFNINHPIDSVYEIGIDVTTQLPDCDNITIFFTDNYNPRRFFNINNIPQVITGYASGNCNQPITSGFLDCNQILVAPNYTDGCIMATEIRAGGQTKAGVYQFGACYCNSLGEPVSDYFVVSNPVPVYDPLKIITPNTDYITGQSIAINISNIDNLHFLYLKLVVAVTINDVTLPRQVGVFNINSSSFIYTYTGNNVAKELPVSVNELLSRRTIYPLAKGVSTSNDILFWYNLTEQRIINLQPVVNNLRLQWQTIEVEEGFYKNGANCSNYLGYERDEVYAFGIEFRTSLGYKLPTFLISAQPSEFYNNGSFYNNSVPYNSYTSVCEQVPGYNTSNFDSLNIPNCCNLPASGIQYPGYCVPPSGCSLNQIWQTYNTATNKGADCGYNASTQNSKRYTTTETCTTDSWIDGQTPPTPCCPPSGPNFTISNCAATTLNTISPATTTTVNTYDTSVTIFQPNWTSDVPSSYVPAGCSSTTSCLQATNPFVPLNPSASNAYILYTSTNTQCAADPYAGNQSFKPTVFFSNTTSPVTNYTIDSSLFTTPNPTTTFSLSNQTWYSFTAGISPVVAITVSMFSPLSNGVKIIGFSDAGITPIVCSTTGYLVMGDNETVATNLPLVAGQTYYFVVFCDPTFPGSPDGAIKWDWATICLNTPAPTGTKTIDVPAVYSQTYTYDVTTTVNVVSNPSCELQTYQHGDFSYWQSTELYPSNPDIWGSLCGKPIRHHKFPDCAVSHIHDAPLSAQYGTNNKIYPIGVRIDVNDIKSILEQAVSQNLISEEEKLSITGYSIKRGNRRNNRSIVGKGFLTDVWRTPLLQLNFTSKKNAFWTPVASDGHVEQVYYPNYIFNDNSGAADPFLSTQQGTGSYPLKAPFKGSINGRYTFHGPNTSFNLPFLTSGQELKLETVENGFTNGGMNEVLYHSKYVLLSSDAYALALALAEIEIAFDSATAAAAAGQGPGGVSFTAGSIITFTMELVILEAIGVTLNSGKYTSQWADIFQKLGTPHNPAVYYTGIGMYNSFTPVLNEGVTRKRAQINNSQYLNPGNYQFQENNTTIRFNNFERESSVYLSTDAFNPLNEIVPQLAFQPTSIFGADFTDTSRTDVFNNYNNNCSVSATYISKTPNIASYYASIKNYVPDQYGTPDQIEWLDTGYCGIIDWKNASQSSICNTIFGGDTYINRFAYKEKMPIFTDDRVFTLTTNIDTDVFYENLGNVGFPNYFFNSAYDYVDGKKGSPAFGFTPPNTQFLCKHDTFFYQIGTCPLYFYSIPYFICESDYNVDLRYGEDELAKNFYPYVADIVNWTQQYQVPISTDNYYFYNNDYSQQNFLNFAYILQNNFSNLTDACQTYHPTRMIWSPQYPNYWLNYLAADFFDFNREDGTVMIIKELEELKVLVVQEQCNKVFNAFTSINTDNTTLAIESGTMLKQFQNKPSQLYNTDLGFGGTETFAIESTSKGTFYIDTRNPAILMLTRTMYGRTITTDILDANSTRLGPQIAKSKVALWMKQNLPFQIIKDYPNVNINNPYKYFGIATCWDNKFDRLFITKRDARVKPEYKNQITYNEGTQEFYLGDTLVMPTDSKYFCNHSWTITYSPVIGEFTSFFTFAPNYYTSLETYYQTGYNFPLGTDSNGLWSHLLTNRSFQVFGGVLCPWMFEYVLKDTINPTILGNVSYTIDLQRYEGDKLDWYHVNEKTINKALIYNQQQSTGLLNLIPTEKNNDYQLISYPKFNSDSIDILTEQVSTFWTFNNFNNIALLNGQPLMTYDCGNVMYKTQNPNALSFQQTYLPNKIKGDYEQIRLINDMWSNYRMIMKFSANQETNTI